MFDRVLFFLGNYHVELVLLSVLGTYINDFKVEFLLIELGLLAEGFLNGFIIGKFYNRCVRVHQILMNWKD